jgi:hypothetical protein
LALKKILYLFERQIKKYALPQPMAVSSRERPGRLAQFRLVFEKIGF